MVSLLPRTKAEKRAMNDPKRKILIPYPTSKTMFLQRSPLFTSKKTVPQTESQNTSRIPILPITGSNPMNTVIAQAIESIIVIALSSSFTVL